MTRRGTAMILALFVVAVVSSAAVLIARAAVMNASAARRAQHDEIVFRAIEMADHPIRHWLKTVGPTVVIPPDAAAPMVHVGAWDGLVGDTEIGIRVDGWDQLGMMPREWEQEFLESSGRVDHSDPLRGDGSLPGLDWFGGVEGVFPSALQPDAPGGLRATHNPWPRPSGVTRAGAGVLINANTAPRWIAARVLDGYPGFDIDDVMRRRARGEFTAVTSDLIGRRGADIRLVSVSSVWAFRVELKIGSHRRSVWCVYADRGGSWTLVQRLIVDGGLEHR